MNYTKKRDKKNIIYTKHIRHNYLKRCQIQNGNKTKVENSFLLSNTKKKEKGKKGEGQRKTNKRSTLKSPHSSSQLKSS